LGGKKINYQHATLEKICKVVSRCYTTMRMHINALHVFSSKINLPFVRCFQTFLLLLSSPNRNRITTFFFLQSKTKKSFLFFHSRGKWDEVFFGGEEWCLGGEMSEWGRLDLTVPNKLGDGEMESGINDRDHHTKEGINCSYLCPSIAS
jgi:hypothetical protein